MKTVHITEPFAGYPNGKKREFTKGEELELSNDYADLIVGKGLGREMSAPAEAKPTAVVSDEAREPRSKTHTKAPGDKDRP